MSSSSRDQLLGYLLGALEPEEHEQIADALARDPALREEMRRLESCVGRLGLADKTEYLEPPPDLVARTCQLVASQRRPVLVLRPTREAAAASRRYTWADLTVAACALITAGAMLFPALAYSRGQAQIAGCQNNLRHVGFALQDFTERQPDNAFPTPELTGNRSAAGVYTVHLNEGGFVRSPKVFLCPGAQNVRPTPGYHPPTFAELDRAIGAALVALQRSMGGDFGANLGYTEGGELRRPCNLRRTSFAIVGDAPSDSQQGRRSSNHAGRGQNVLYEDGHVRLVIIIPSPEDLDDPLHNRDGYVAAGLDCNDSCLGRSHDRPMIVVP